MRYNPNIHHRRSVRLKGYDYSQVGAYFITICTQSSECLFGEITDGKMELNDAGTMIEKWYFELMNKFPDIRCGEHIVMPNHIHCIIHNVGANLCVRPNENICANKTVGANLRVRPIEGQTHNIKGQTHRFAPTTHETGEHIGSPLRNVIQWFKTMTTNEYIRHVKRNGWKPFNGRLWQRNYYEHIIRNEIELNQICEYILNNPLKWELDEEYVPIISWQEKKE